MLPPESNTGSGSGTAVLPDNNKTESIDDIIKFFGADDDPNEKNEEVVSDLIAANDPETLEKGKNKDKDKEEEPEIDLKEEEEKEIDENELVDIIVPGRQIILKKYPELFKDFPAIEKAIYRERAYAEVFPTVKDAKDAAEEANNFRKFEEKILDGDLTDVLTAVNKEDRQSFIRLVDNLLPTLSKVDREGYNYILGSVIENTIFAMYTEGVKQQNDTLQEAAKIVNMYVFGNADVKQPNILGTKTKKSSPEDDKIQQERADFITEKFEHARDNISERTNNLLKSAVTKLIDPKGSMNDYTKKTAINDVLSMVESNISEDSRFKSNIDKLWERAFENNFSESSLLDIRNAYLSKAKTLLRPIVDKVRTDALKGLSRIKNKEDREEELEGEVKRHTSEGRQKKQESTNTPNKPPKKMSTFDFLSSD